MKTNGEFSAFLIAGTNSGCGKTTLTLGILRALTRRGLRVAPFKCGPDYIDPAFHAAASGRVSYQLDTFFGSESDYASAVGSACADVAVIEGVMGLFDGIAPGDPRGSCAEIARRLSLPVLLAVNARGLSGSIAPLVKGFADWDAGVRIAGVIADRVGSARHAELLAEALRAAGLPPLIGFLERDDRWLLPERHLGLSLEMPDSGRLDDLADALERNFDFDRLLHLTRTPRPVPDEPTPIPPPRLRLGVARDEAFSFYYPANFDCLRRNGVEIVPFSPLHDAALPERLDGIFLGGGYPELYGDALGANRTMNDALRAFARRHFLYGECGGYLYLLEEFRDPEGRAHPGLGLLPGRARMNARPAALGYRTVRGAWGTARGHEFHYSSLTDAPAPPFLWEAEDARGSRSSCGGRRGRVAGSYVHIFFNTAPEFVRAFLREMEQ